MCGRATLTMPIEEIAEALGVPPVVTGTPLPPGPPPRYNLAPGQSLVVLRTPPASGEGRELAYARWGLVPPGVHDPRLAHKGIQVRSETAAVVPSYRDAFRARRCVVVVDGFYEWSHGKGAQRMPHHVKPASGGLLPLAGLWERAVTKDGEEVDTCAVLTMRAGPRIAALHDRMPLVLRDDELDAWLHGSREEALAITKSPSERDTALVVVPVSKLVNNVRNDAPACLAPWGEDPASEPSGEAPAPPSRATRSQLGLFR